MSLVDQHHPQCAFEHNQILIAIKDYGKVFENIETNTKTMSDTLALLRDDNKDYVKLIAGKKQVPLSIFSFIVITLTSLLVASEVRYSGISINIKWSEGITISREK